MSQDTNTAPDAERAAFEAWCHDGDRYSTARDWRSDGAYNEDDTTAAWKAWQARAALEQPAAQVAAQPVAWSRARYIKNRDGHAIGTDDPEVSWGAESPDEAGWSPLYAAPQAPAAAPQTDINKEST